ncbi:unnamed protein product [Sphagnum troendelagicum]|uniref:Uncharacterized protein n=1 Tax=Sphagnum troendelagicum TaxID=128251 RepID=A0ABP0UA27_9BRYO
MAAVSQASYGHATPSWGTTSLKKKKEKGERIYTASRASTRERAKRAGRGGTGKRKGQRRGKESSAQDAFLTDRGMLRNCVSADRAGGRKNGAVTAGKRGGGGGGGL